MSDIPKPNYFPNELSNIAKAFATIKYGSKEYGIEETQKAEIRMLCVNEDYYNKVLLIAKEYNLPLYYMILVLAAGIDINNTAHTDLLKSRYNLDYINFVLFPHR